VKLYPPSLIEMQKKATKEKQENQRLRKKQLEKILKDIDKMEA